MSHLNGIQSKQLNQLNSKDGEAFTATSAPGWFIKGNSTYGEAFSPERPGNLVKFFTTGSDYFKDVASAIKNAKKSIFISGWQINYEVRLEGDTRLWDCLNHALRKKGETPDIYLMPWLSPKAAVDTGDLETMVAAFILNAGLKKKKVWCLPAIQQSDMGSLGLFFSHHQKMVVIDNEVAYVGGIDLAYGRRDDNNFRLAADGRTANEFYNPCIPALKEIDPHQQYPYMTTVELISAALLEGDVLSKAQRKLAWAMDNKMFNVLRQAKKEVGEWFSDKGKDGMRLLGAGAAYSTGSVLYIAEFVKRQMTGDNLEAWKNTLRQWKVSLDGAVNTIDQEAQTLKKTDSTLTELRQEAKSISLAIGVWLEKPQEASAIQQRVEDWLVRAQQKVPMLTSMTQSGRARLQNQVGQLKSEVQMWVQRVTPQLDQLQQDLSTWATQIIKSGGQLTDKLLNEGSELTSLWIQQTGLGAFYAWINNTPSPILTAKALQELEQIATPFILYLHSVLDRLSETQKDEPYSYLADPATRLLPRGGMMLDDKTQPRMPWHDVHMRLEGSSVYDLSRNFIGRWNSLQARFDGKVQKMPSALIGLLKFATKNLEPVPFKAHYLAQPERVAPTGEMNVQVLRSAPMRMRNEERQGAAKAGHNLTSAAPNGVQANCLQAMLQAISGAQHFIYIENQFFQSEYGADSAETAAVTAGPMQSLMKIEGLPGYEIYKDRLRLGNLQDNPKSLANVDYFELARMIRNKEAETFTQGVMQVLSNQSTVEILKGMQTPQNAIKNPLCEALAERIERAIEMGENFHVYMVLPVHPEGPLNALNLMTQVHLTMQSLSLGEQSLIKRIQRAMAIKAQMDRGKTETQAIESIKFFKDRTETKRVFEDEDWSRYLTLLNLRSWEEINQQPVTEQIYIHSKLLIADDRIAILGSANINDRSQMGDRDSELAVVVAGSTSLPTSINGRMQYPVCPQVKQLRTDLWRKIFALNAQPRKNSVQPASDLEKVIATPAAAATWQAIQRQAFSNAEAYEQAFRHVPRNDASIWPLWGQVSVAPPSSSAAVKGASNAMPFEKEFWLSTMAGKHPTTVCGFITALPIHWTKYENNNSGFNLTILAKIEPTRDRAATSQHYAVLAQDTQSKERT